MTEKSKRMIQKYLDKVDGPDPDKAVREIAGVRLWETGDKENQRAAIKIWRDVGLSEDDMEFLLEDFLPHMVFDLYNILGSE